MTLVKLLALSAVASGQSSSTGLPMAMAMALRILGVRRLPLMTWYTACLETPILVAILLAFVPCIISMPRISLFFMLRT